MEKIFSTDVALQKAYGARIAEAIGEIMFYLESTSHLGEMPTTEPGKCHQLRENRKGQFAVKLTGNMRLVFRPNYDPLPLKADGGIDLEQVMRIKILEVVDYH